MVHPLISSSCDNPSLCSLHREISYFEPSPPVWSPGDSRGLLLLRRYLLYSSHFLLGISETYMRRSVSGTRSEMCPKAHFCADGYENHVIRGIQVVFWSRYFQPTYCRTLNDVQALIEVGQNHPDSATKADSQKYGLKIHS
jgi:hypothetical protein